MSFADNIFNNFIEMQQTALLNHCSYVPVSHSRVQITYMVELSSIACISKKLNTQVLPKNDSLLRNCCTLMETYFIMLCSII